MQKRIVPDVVRDQTLVHANEAMTIKAAADLMAVKRIGAVMVMKDGRLAGIFTERDVLTRVVAAGLDPARVTVGQVMTRDPDTVVANDTALHALGMMSRKGYRHLPVVDGARVVGIVSARDLYGAVMAELEEDLRDLDAFVHGSGYGGPG